MTEEVTEDGADEQMKKLEALETLEVHAWNLFYEARDTKDTPLRDRLAALKMISELLLAQMRHRKETQPQEDTESVQYYIEQFDSLRERVDQLAERHGAVGTGPGAGRARVLR